MLNGHEPDGRSIAFLTLALAVLAFSLVGSPPSAVFAQANGLPPDDGALKLRDSVAWSPGPSIRAVSRARPRGPSYGFVEKIVLAQLQNDGGGPSALDPNLADAPQPDATAPPAKKEPEKLGGLRLLQLFVDAGLFFMIPFLLASIAIVALIIERFISLNSRKVMPPGLITGLGQLGGAKGGFDPRRAYRLCQQFPSATSTVIRAMLLKVGRPHSEVEHAVIETSEREANRMYGNVRWLTLTAAVAPLWGLLGTVWGILVAFHETSQLEKGQNMATSLAEGIYTALVTTLCGLLIAIPSAIFAHYFEGRVTNLFHQIDELLFNLLPQIERYEGRLRFNRGSEDGETPVPLVEKAGIAADPDAAATPK